MKKVMATMLAAATAATMLSGCGSSNSGSTETKAAETTAAAESGGQEAIYLTGTAWQTAQIEQLLILQIRQMYM